MELIAEPDIYSPIMDESGNYIDKIPNIHIIRRGIRCPCGSRIDKIHQTTSSFTSHIKTKTHQKWLVELNCNKINYVIENQDLKSTIMNQRIIIANLEKDIAIKIKTIDFLTQSLISANGGVNANTIIDTNDLIDFD